MILYIKVTVDSAVLKNAGGARSHFSLCAFMDILQRFGNPQYNMHMECTYASVLIHADCNANVWQTDFYAVQLFFIRMFSITHKISALILALCLILQVLMLTIHCATLTISVLVGLGIYQPN